MKNNGQLRKNERKVTVVKDGPYRIEGAVHLSVEKIVSDAGGTPIRWEQGKQFVAGETYYLCRCGMSVNKPFCDGSHKGKNFDGTETASRVPYKDMAEITSGPELIMNDSPCFCAIARFCHRDGDAWTLTEKSQDLYAKKTAIQEACDCPSGRLVAQDPKTGKVFEPVHPPSIGIVEDPGKKLSGPLWVRGGIPVKGADGKEYEVRNRVTLCRCGQSKNKPFCDGTHIEIEYNDGDPSVR